MTAKNKLPLIEFEKNKKVKAAVIFPEVLNQPLSLSADSRLEEAVGLALAINLDVVYKEIIKVRAVKPSTFVGQGVLERLKPLLEAEETELLIVDTSLTPIQQRTLENKLKIKVIDRTALILEIFGERAQTREGKLQVELAHLTYQRSRLVRSWTHLERQRGGAGFLGGPGETQIELDRRIIDDKIVRIKKELEKVRQTRQIQRSARQRIPYPVIALVGYTNAGKSSLFNQLSAAGVFCQRFAFCNVRSGNAQNQASFRSGGDSFRYRRFYFRFAARTYYGLSGNPGGSSVCGCHCSCERHCQSEHQRTTAGRLKGAPQPGIGRH